MSLLQKLPEDKPTRIKLGVGVAITLLLLLRMCSSGETAKPVVTEHPKFVEEAPLPPAPPNAENSKLILELFNPSDQSLTNQITNTTISQQIEQTLTMTYVLTKCQIISQDDYTNIFRDLIFYAERTKLAADPVAAEAAVRQIAESANASYALVYSRTSCTDKQLPPLANDILKWSHGIARIH